MSSQLNIKPVSSFRDITKEFQHLHRFINSIVGSDSITFKGGKIDTSEPVHKKGIPNFAGLKLGKVSNAKFDLTVQDTFTFANEGYIEGYDGRGFFLGFDDFDNYVSTLFEIDNVVIRGSLFARQFTIDTWTYRAGNEIQGAGGGIVSDTDGSTYFELEDMSGNSGLYCNVGDVVMCQEVDRKGVTYDVNGDVVDDSYLIKRLIYKVSSVSGNKCYLTSVTGAPGNKATLSKGDQFAILYSETDPTRSNVIGYMNNMKYAPYIFMKTGISSWATWSATNNVNLVLGRLDSFSDSDFGAMSDFGLYATNVYLKGHISLADNGYISLGKTAYNDTTHAGFWFGDSDATATINPYFYLGAASDAKYLKIDTTAGTFNTLGFEIAAGAIKSTSTMTYARGTAGTEFGYWLGKYGTNDYRFYMGSSASKYFAFDNTNITLVGGTITGGTIQTAASEQRVVMDGSNNWIKFYDSSGGDCGYINGATGDLNLYADLSIVMTVANDNIELTAAKTISLTGGSYKFLMGSFGGGIGIYNGLNSIGLSIPSASLLSLTGSFSISGDLSVTGSYGLAASDLPTGIDATKIGAGGVTSTEFGYIGTLTSNAQSQLNNRLQLQTTATQTLGGTSYAYGFLFQRLDGTNAPATFDQRGAGLLMDIRQAGTTKVSISNSGVLKAVGYQSSDGTSGATANVDPSTVSTINFKDGLFTGTT